MYDTTTFILPQAEYSRVNFLEEIPNRLNNIATYGESQHGPFINGYLETFKVSINPHRLKIQGSSLAKYINGDNQQGMSLQQTRTAIKSLSDKLHLDIVNARVTRLDFGRNIVTRYSPDTYLPYLGESTGYKRQEAGGGLYYKNSLRVLAIYDKIREQKARKNPINPLFMGHNLFRYELRLTSNIARQLKTEVAARELMDEGFYIRIGKLWRDQFLKIVKRTNKTVSIPSTGSTRELMISLAAITIQNIGDDNLIRMIAEWQQQDTLTKKQACDHRKAIRETAKKLVNDKGNEFMDELTKKIKEATRFFI